MVLQTIWFFLWGLLWAIFFMTDGFDLEIGTLYPFLGKTDQDRRHEIRKMLADGLLEGEGRDRRELGDEAHAALDVVLVGLRLLVERRQRSDCRGAMEASVPWKIGRTACAWRARSRSVSSVLS